MPAPVASGWSGRRVGLAPAGNAPPCHGARGKRHFERISATKVWGLQDAQVTGVSPSHGVGLRREEIAEPTSYGHRLRAQNEFLAFGDALQSAVIAVQSPPILVKMVAEARPARRVHPPW